MKKYHPTDSRYRGPQTPARTPRSVRQFAAEPVSKRPLPPPLIEEPDHVDEQPETKLEAIARKSESYLQLIPFGYLVSDLEPFEKREAVSSKEWRNTIIKFGAGLGLYFLLTTFFSQSVTTF